ncbi:MAG: DUF3102 domain-containing protein [Clostridia bacterium]|nr:DUF3102 domain-containing protein [Clostridia bacterium]
MMNEPANTESNALSTLDMLGKEARMYSEAMVMNLFQLGRVLTEAKSLCSRGEWGQWLQNNTDMSERHAQQIMGVYRRFGDRPAFTGIEKAKLFSMLSLPEGTEEDFIVHHDVQDMTSREVQEAVKKARAEAKAEAQAEIDEANRAREEAEMRAAQAENRPAELPEDVAETLRTQKQQIEQLQEVGRDAMNESRFLQQENNKLQRELKEQGELLEEAQAQCNRAQADLLNAQSALARGDAERTPSDTLTPDALAAAVNTFIGAVCRMPHMHGTFATMDGEMRREYAELLSTVEDWAKGARSALNTAGGEGSVY